MIARLAQAYLAMKRLSAPSEGSWAVIRSELKIFLEFVEEQELSGPADLTPELLARFQTAVFYRTTRFGRTSCPSSQASVLIAARGFLGYLVREGYLLSDPSAALELPRVPKRLPPGGLTRAQAELLLAAPDPATRLGSRDRAILETLYATGVRASELLALHLSDLGGDEEAPTARVRKGKGGKDRIVPLGLVAHRAITEYLDGARPRFFNAAVSPFLFLSKKGRRIHISTLNNLIDHHAQAAGIERHVTAHVLRHTCATLMLKGGCDIRYIQALLGHASLSTTQLYTKVDIADLARAHARFHPRSFPRGKPRAPADRYTRGASPWASKSKRPK